MKFLGLSEDLWEREDLTQVTLQLQFVFLDQSFKGPLKILACHWQLIFIEGLLAVLLKEVEGLIQDLNGLRLNHTVQGGKDGGCLFGV